MQTPGPWKLDERVGCIAVYPAGETHACLSEASDWAIHYAAGYQVKDEKGQFAEWMIDPQKIANAKLIAAAPDLLEACLDALSLLAELYDPDTINAQRIDAMDKKLRQAIDKAEGE